MQFDEHLCDISHGFNRHGASRGPSAIAELVVVSCVSLQRFAVTSVHAKVRSVAVHSQQMPDLQFLGGSARVTLSQISFTPTHVRATEGLEASSWQTKDNVAVNSRMTDLQRAVNTGVSATS